VGTNLQIAWRFIVSRKRAMAMTLIGIVFGIAFFIVAQAQTTGFAKFFERTIIGTNGAIRISDRYQSTGTITASSENEVRFDLQKTVGSRYVEGIDYPSRLREAIQPFEEVTGISEILEGRASLDTGLREHTAQAMGIRLQDHLTVSDLSEQIVFGSLKDFGADRSGLLLGHRLAERLNLHPGDKVNLVGMGESLRLRVSAIFETGVSEIDKRRVYMDLATARSFFRQPAGGAVFQIGVRDPDAAPEVAAQMQAALDHRVVSWQEREKVWLDVFKVLRLSSAVTVSTILLLSGLGMFNVFALMVIEKTRDIAILRSMGFTRADVSRIFLLQGGIVLVSGALLGSVFGALATYGISKVPLRIRGVFSTDHFVVHWDWGHYAWAIGIAVVIMALASWVPARRAARVEPAKIIREAT
jgi:lipoprotein-releasing system permease protein